LHDKAQADADASLLRARALARRRAAGGSAGDASDDEDAPTPRSLATATSAQAGPQPIATPALEGMEVAQLVRECIRRGIDNSGTEKEMRKRLARARAQSA